MNKMKNRWWIIVAAVVMAAAIAVAVVLRPGAGPQPPSLDNSPEVYLNANASLTPDRLIDVDAFVDEDYIASQGGQLLLAKVMTFAELCSMQEEDVADHPTVSPDRLVLVVQVYWPGGFADPDFGRIENCTATAAYDAETGNYLGSWYKGGE